MSIRNVDWDGVITFGLTIVVALATFGGGFVVAAYRVVTVARMRVDNMQATELLIVPGMFYLWFSVGKQWAVLTRNGRMLARVT